MTTTKSTTDGFRAAAEYVRQLEETNARLKEEVEQADRHAKAVEANFVRTVAKLTRENDRLKDENTPLREERDALRSLLSETRDLLGVAQGFVASIPTRAAWNLNRQINESMARPVPAESQPAPTAAVDGTTSHNIPVCGQPEEP